MKFLPYEDVPLYLGVSGHSGEYILAESASLSVSQDLKTSRHIDDNIIQICQFDHGDNYPYVSPSFLKGSSHIACLGPSGGPPQPLSTSIFKIPEGTKISFPNGKELFFENDILPDGHNYLVNLISKSGTWTLSKEEASSGYFQPIFNHSTTAPVKGSLDVSFYPNTGNLQSFFNITGISDPKKYPPIDEERITGFLGDFKFSDVYLESFRFSVSPNSISQAQARFTVYGELEKDSSISDSYYSSELYKQQSIPHGRYTSLIGTSDLGIDNPVKFDYTISVNREARFIAPTGSSYESNGSTPVRVSKKGTTINMKINGENIDPNILENGFNGKRANLKVYLKDLSYSSFEDNSNGLLNTFECSGVINSQSLSVNSNGYLNGGVSVFQTIN